MPQIDCFVHDYIRFFAIITRVIFNDFDGAACVQLVLQIVSCVRANRDEQKDDNLIGTASNSIEDSN